jgi:hypothetical protein
MATANLAMQNNLTADVGDGSRREELAVSISRPVYRSNRTQSGRARRPLLTKSVRFHGDGDIAVGGKTDLVSLDIGHQVHIDEMVV